MSPKMWEKFLIELKKSLKERPLSIEVNER